MITLSPHPPRTRPSLDLPPISEIPILPPDALAEYALTTRPWDRDPITLPTSITRGLWIILVGTAAVAGWLVAVRAWYAPHSGLVYTVATLGHPRLVLILAVIATVVLLGLAPFTRGLTRAGSPELAVMIVAGVAGVVAVLGAVALAVLTVAVAFLAVAAIVAAVERS
jgi:hypothetical protein